MALIIPLATMTVLTAMLASLLLVAHCWLFVEEDPRVDAVEQMLPRTNCGGCGYPGCHAFAEALIAGEALPGKCTAGLAEDHLRIAAYLGVAAGSEERRVARLACAGGSNVSRYHAHYQGMKSCAAATLVSGGGKGCFWGCLGYGDCGLACEFDAIEMNRHLLPVVDEQRCTACGDCVNVCPKDLFSLQPISQRLWVACSSQEAGEEILEDCQVACTGCERCAHDAPELITMVHDLPVIDYSKASVSPAATQSCPTGAIVWIDEQLGPIKGGAARKIIRKGAISDAPT